MDPSAFDTWTRRYRGAWETNDPDEIGALFTDDAEYLHKPAAPPWNGRDEIAREWLARKDEPGDTTFEWKVIATDGDLGIVRGVTFYRSSDTTYDNLWEVELDSDGRCRRFVEWWVEREALGAGDESERQEASLREEVGRLNHDLRNGLGGILGFASLLREEEGLSQQQKEDLTDIYTAGQKMLERLNEMRDRLNRPDGDDPPA